MTSKDKQATPPSNAAGPADESWKNYWIEFDGEFHDGRAAAPPWGLNFQCTIKAPSKDLAIAWAVIAAMEDDYIVSTEETPTAAGWVASISNKSTAYKTWVYIDNVITYEDCQFYLCIDNEDLIVRPWEAVALQPSLLN